MDRSALTAVSAKPPAKKNPSSIRWRAGLYERLQKHAELLAQETGRAVPVQTLINDVLESTVDEWDNELGIDTRV